MRRVYDEVRSESVEEYPPGLVTFLGVAKEDVKRGVLGNPKIARWLIINETDPIRPAEHQRVVGKKPHGKYLWIIGRIFYSVKQPFKRNLGPARTGSHQDMPWLHRFVRARMSRDSFNGLERGLFRQHLKMKLLENQYPCIGS